MRQLAERAAQSAADAGELIAGIQGETDDAVELVREAATRTHAGTEASDRARTSLEEIDGAVGRITLELDGMGRLTSDIAAFAEETAASAEQMSATTQQTNASTQEVVASVDQLSSQSEALSALTQQLRTGVDRRLRASPASSARIPASASAWSSSARPPSVVERVVGEADRQLAVDHAGADGA